MLCLVPVVIFMIFVSVFIFVVVVVFVVVFFFQAEDGIRDHCVTGVQTCALPISCSAPRAWVQSRHSSGPADWAETRRD